MEQKKERLCISVREMAKELGIGITTAYKLAKTASFYPAKKICGRYVVAWEQLKKWLNEQGN
jgi:predicted DNA-binding transcriptional regulator AlpA